MRLPEAFNTTVEFDTVYRDIQQALRSTYRFRVREENSVNKGSYYMFSILQGLPEVPLWDIRKVLESYPLDSIDIKPIPSSTDIGFKIEAVNYESKALTKYNTKSLIENIQLECEKVGLWLSSQVITLRNLTLHISLKESRGILRNAEDTIVEKIRSVYPKADVTFPMMPCFIRIAPDLYVINYRASVTVDSLASYSRDSKGIMPEAFGFVKQEAGVVDSEGMLAVESYLRSNGYIVCESDILSRELSINFRLNLQPLFDLMNSRVKALLDSLSKAYNVEPYSMYVEEYKGYRVKKVFYLKKREGKADKERLLMELRNSRLLPKGMGIDNESKDTWCISWVVDTQVQLLLDKVVEIINSFLSQRYKGFYLKDKEFRTITEQFILTYNFSSASTKSSQKGLMPEAFDSSRTVVTIENIQRYLKDLKGEKYFSEVVGSANKLLNIIFPCEGMKTLTASMDRKIKPVLDSIVSDYGYNVRVDNTAVFEIPGKGYVIVKNLDVEAKKGESVDAKSMGRGLQNSSILPDGMVIGNANDTAWFIQWYADTEIRRVIDKEKKKLDNILSQRFDTFKFISFEIDEETQEVWMLYDFTNTLTSNTPVRKGSLPEIADIHSRIKTYDSIGEVLGIGKEFLDTHILQGIIERIRKESDFRRVTEVSRYGLAVTFPVIYIEDMVKPLAKVFSDYIPTFIYTIEARNYGIPDVDFTLSLVPYDRVEYTQKMPPDLNKAIQKCFKGLAILKSYKVIGNPLLLEIQLNIAMTDSAKPEALISRLEGFVSNECLYERFDSWTTTAGVSGKDAISIEVFLKLKPGKEAPIAYGNLPEVLSSSLIPFELPENQLRDIEVDIAEKFGYRYTSFYQNMFSVYKRLHSKPELLPVIEDIKKVFSNLGKTVRYLRTSNSSKYANIAYISFRMDKRQLFKTQAEWEAFQISFRNLLSGIDSVRELDGCVVRLTNQMPSQSEGTINVFLIVAKEVLNSEHDKAREVKAYLLQRYGIVASEKITYKVDAFQPREGGDPFTDYTATLTIEGLQSKQNSAKGAVVEAFGGIQPFTPDKAFREYLTSIKDKYDAEIDWENAWATGGGDCLSIKYSLHTTEELKLIAKDVVSFAKPYDVKLRAQYSKQSKIKDCIIIVFFGVEATPGKDIYEQLPIVVAKLASYFDTLSSGSPIHSVVNGRCKLRAASGRGSNILVVTLAYEESYLSDFRRKGDKIVDVISKDYGLKLDYFKSTVVANQFMKTRLNSGYEILYSIQGKESGYVDSFVGIE